MTEDEVRHTSKVTVQEVLDSMGFDTSDRIAMQKQMAAIREFSDLMQDDQFKADLIMLRKWRLASEKANDIGFTTAITIIVTGTLGALWIGIKEVVK